ncbi:MAG: hypothetical protein JXR96_03305 [Deltaproteobacteria bacterium]|nr:hypothetical protein [Deltaproteobacteria bacterium]
MNRFAFLLLAAPLVACSSAPEKPDQAPAQVAAQPQAATLGQDGRARPGETLKQYDLNHDNRPDVWAYYGPMVDPADPNQTKNSLVRKEWDFNFDGKVDIRRFFNFKGETVKDELDLDFDGNFDVTSYYQNGLKIRQEYDFNFDTKPDYWKFFEKNAVARTERDRDFNGRVDRWEYYSNGKLDRVGLDEDGDGQIDKWLQQAKP